jgi:glycosyltransferase involved in cell wall biosynthesis
MELLSVVVITYNESKHIKRCLDSVQDIANEIIVIDSGSTDNTVVIAQSCGTKVVHQDWLGYGEQKNFANSLTQNDWILSLDADEALSSELKEEIIVELKNPRFKVYSMNRCNRYCGKWLRFSGWYPDTKLRLFNKNAAYWNTNRVHEILMVDLNIPVGKFKSDILHYPFDSVVEHKQRAEKYALLGAEQLFLKGKKPNCFKLYFGASFRFFRDYFLNLGFLDGNSGFWACKITAQAVSKKYREAIKLFKEAKKRQ